MLAMPIVFLLRLATPLADEVRVGLAGLAALAALAALALPARVLPAARRDPFRPFSPVPGRGPGNARRGARLLPQPLLGGQGSGTLLHLAVILAPEERVAVKDRAGLPADGARVPRLGRAAPGLGLEAEDLGVPLLSLPPPVLGAAALAALPRSVLHHAAATFILREAAVATRGARGRRRGGGGRLGQGTGPSPRRRPVRL